MGKIYRGIREQNGSDERASALSEYERLASEHPEYRRVVRDVAKARDHHGEIDALLMWYDKLSRDVNIIDEDTDEPVRTYDTDRMQEYIYSWKNDNEPNGLHTTEYAGSLDEDGEARKIYSPVYNTTFKRLYDEVMNLVAYAHYHIPHTYPDKIVVPISACNPWEVTEPSYKEWLEDMQEDEEIE